MNQIKVCLCLSFYIGLLCGLALAQDPPNSNIQKWARWEVERNDLHNDTSKFKPLPSRRELNQLQSYNELIKVEVPADELNYYLNSDHEYDLSGDFFHRHNDGQVYLDFYTHPHPLAQTQFAPILGNRPWQTIPVTASSSARSFFYPPYILKVSLPKKIGDLDRSLYQLQMKRATTISHLISEVPQSRRNENHFGYLKESLAVYGNLNSCPFGYIVREIPKEISEGNKSLAPLFAFVAYPQNDPQQDSLLEENAKKLNLSLQEVVIEKILTPLVESFAFLALEAGVIMEGHQQNTLLEIDANNVLTGKVFYRDLDGARVDIDYRQAHQLDNTFLTGMSDELIDWTFQIQRIRELNHQQMKGDSNPKLWNGAFEYAYRSYIEDCSIDLLTWALERSEKKMHQYKRHGRVDLKLKARQILNHYLEQRHGQACSNH